MGWPRWRPLHEEQLWLVLQRLCNVGRLDRLALCQIGDRPRQLQYPVIGARGEIELAHRQAHQTFPRVVQLADLASYHQDVMDKRPYTFQ